MIFEIISVMLVFVVFYIVAFISHRNYRDKDDILFIAKSQWEAILLQVLLLLVALLMR